MRALPDPQAAARRAALATVVGVLIEVPVMLSVVWIVNRSRPWYEAGAAVRRVAAQHRKVS